MNTVPDTIRSRRATEGYECTMTWACVSVTGHGRTREEASGAAALLYRSALWLVVQKQAKA